MLETDSMQLLQLLPETRGCFIKKLNKIVEIIEKGSKMDKNTTIKFEIKAELNEAEIRELKAIVSPVLSNLYYCLISLRFKEIMEKRYGEDSDNEFDYEKYAGNYCYCYCDRYNDWWILEENETRLFRDCFLKIERIRR